MGSSISYSEVQHKRSFLVRGNSEMGWEKRKQPEKNSGCRPYHFKELQQNNYADPTG
jgi:hypothetical protein